MDFGLESVSLTLAVGALAVLIISFNLSFHLDTWSKLIKFFKEEQKGHFFQLTLIIFFAIIFSLGVLFENLRPRVYNSEFNKSESWVHHVLLPNHKNDLRVDCILGSITARDDSKSVKCDGDNLTHQALGLKIVKHDSPPSIYTLYGQTIEVICQKKQNGKTDTENTVRSGVISLYYEAKNRVFKEPTYFAELSKLEDRYNFSGAVSLLGLIGFLLTLVNAIIAWFKNQKRKYASTNKVWFRVFACLLLPANKNPQNLANNFPQFRSLILGEKCFERIIPTI